MATPLLSVWLPPVQVIVLIGPPLNESLNVIVPVGGPGTDVDEATVAVKVTFWLTKDGFSDELTVVVVPDLLTVCTEAVLVLGSKFPSPL